MSKALAAHCTVQYDHRHPSIWSLVVKKLLYYSLVANFLNSVYMYVCVHYKPFSIQVCNCICQLYGLMGRLGEGMWSSQRECVGMHVKQRLHGGAPFTEEPE